MSCGATPIGDRGDGSRANSRSLFMSRPYLVNHPIKPSWRRSQAPRRLTLTYSFPSHLIVSFFMRRPKQKYFLPFKRDWLKDKSSLKIMQKSRQLAASFVDAHDSVMKAGAHDARYDVWVSSRA